MNDNADAPAPEPAPPAPPSTAQRGHGLTWIGRRLAMPGQAGDRARGARAKLILLLAERLVANAERQAEGTGDEAPSEPE